VPPLTSDRNTPAMAGDLRSGPIAAGETIHGGALVMRDATGHLVAGATALNLTGVGRAEEAADNAAGADDDKSLSYRPGIFRFRNSAAAGLVTIAETGTVCFAVDDQTVAKTDGTGTRSKAGVVEEVDALGVWVRLDEALTRTTS